MPLAGAPGGARRPYVDGPPGRCRRGVGAVGVGGGVCGGALVCRCLEGVRMSEGQDAGGNVSTEPNVKNVSIASDEDGACLNRVETIRPPG